MTRLIDVMHLGRDRVIAAHELRHGLIVDPGPASCVETLLDGLEAEPRALLLTHIHLDHAGAAGVLVRRFPALRVYVHENGAPHVVDPQRLLRSASRLYGPENMERLWGEVAPVPAENVIAVRGGEEALGMRVEHVPGHASHHVAYLDLSDGDAFVGDMAGVRLPPGSYTIAPTPPPEIDVEAWLRSIDLIEAMGPRRLRLTHFGAAEDVADQLERARAALRRNAELARDFDREAFLAMLGAEIDRASDPATAARLRQAAPPEHLWAGLERYWTRRV